MRPDAPRRRMTAVAAPGAVGPSTAPPTTSTTGYGMPLRRPRPARTATASSRKTKSSTPATVNGYPLARARAIIPVSADRARRPRVALPAAAGEGAPGAGVAARRRGAGRARDRPRGANRPRGAGRRQRARVRRGAARRRVAPDARGLEPVQPAAVRVGPSDRAAVLRERERAGLRERDRRGCRERGRDVGDHVRRLVRDPDGAEAANRAREALDPIAAQVGEHRGV